MCTLSPGLAFNMPKRNKPSLHGSTRGVGHSSYLSDYWGGTASSGSTIALTRGMTILPRDRAFRIRWIRFQVVGKDTFSACFQIRVYGPQNTAEATWCSGPRLVGVTPVRLFQRVTVAASPLYPRGLADNVTLLAIDNICQAKGDAANLRFIAEIDFELEPEEFLTNCPAKLAQGDDPDTTMCTCAHHTNSLNVAGNPLERGLDVECGNLRGISASPTTLSGGVASAAGRAREDKTTSRTVRRPSQDSWEEVIPPCQDLPGELKSSRDGCFTIGHIRSLSL